MPASAVKVEPIEIHKYEPNPENPPYLRYAGNRTVGEVFEELQGRLKAEGLLPEEYFDLVYSSVTRGARPEPRAEFPDCRTIACYPVTGRSEGYYIHVDALVARHGKEGFFIEAVPLFLGKTFQGFDFAAAVANACAKHLGA